MQVESLSKDDGNGKDDARKQWSDWLNEEKQSCCTCGTRFSTILSLTQSAKWQREVSKFMVLTTTGTPILRRTYQSTCSVICQQYRMQAKSNNRKIVTIVQMFIFKWYFICRSRWGCLSSLVVAYTTELRQMERLVVLRRLPLTPATKSFFILCMGTLRCIVLSRYNLL